MEPQTTSISMTPTAAPLNSAAQHFIAQSWSEYAPHQHSVWYLLFSRRMRQLQDVACKQFFAGAKAIGLQPTSLPHLGRMNQRLSALTGWQAVAVDGFISAELFFACLAKRRFPTTVTIRPMQQLDYLPEPDIFHDVFGHVPMHADQRFAAMLQRFGEIGTHSRTERETERLARLFWFTVEFGLVREEGQVRVYGSGLISSAKDCANALSEHCERRDFDLDKVLCQEFATDQLQRVLFVVESFEQVEEALRRW